MRRLAPITAVLQGDEPQPEEAHVATDEVCMAVGYFFPVSAPLWCVNGLGPF